MAILRAARLAPARPAAATISMLVACILTPVAVLMGTSPSSISLAGLSFIFIVLVLWRSDDPPILLLPALFQWSEVATFPIATIWKQVPLNEMSAYGANLELSAAYGFAGVSALAAGMSLGSGRSSGIPLSFRLQVETAAWTSAQMRRIGLMWMAAGYLISGASTFAGPARELLANAGNVRYVGLFLIAYWCLAMQRDYRFLAGVALFEVAFGMTGFFADFKNSILTFLVAAIAARPRMRSSDVLTVIAAAAFVVFVGTFWSAIKADYRLMANKGTGEQAVYVPLEDRLSYLMDATTSLDGDKIALGFDRLVLRHGYIDYLALVMQAVPESIPHENGALTLATLSHITMPRLLFPDKPPLPSDTEIMAKYTGLTYTWDSNTSISIGNLGELYIDFGLLGGLVAELVIGCLVGLVFRFLREFARCPALITAGFCVMSVLPIAYFGIAYIKLIGAFIATSAAAIMVQRLVVPGIVLAQRLPLAPFSTRVPR